MKRTLALCALLLIVAACAPAEQQAAPEVAPFKIGFVGPLSGPNAWIGNLMIPAAQIAIDEINAAGGIDGRRIVAIIEDAGDSAKASTAVNKLIGQDGVDMVYAVTTPVVAAASAVAEQNQVPLFGFTAVSTFAKKNTWVFSDLREMTKECSLLAAQALEDGDKKVAFLGNDADFSVECLDVLKKEYVAGGGTIVATENKNANDPDARTPITKIKAAKPD
ncbi:MAG: ABC transporter substrate-binding protein, partial [Nanoarchaeota archaeon]